MAFVVEMVWGRPHRLVIYGRDAEGGLAPSRVEPTGEPPDPEWREFSCHGRVWERVLALGREAGWKPKSTVPSECSREEWNRLGRFDGSYEPEEWRYAKQVQADDAAALADAFCARAASSLPGTIEAAGAKEDGGDSALVHNLARFDKCMWQDLEATSTCPRPPWRGKPGNRRGPKPGQRYREPGPAPVGRLNARL